MTLIRELIDIPTQVRDGGFDLKLTEGVGDGAAEATVASTDSHEAVLPWQEQLRYGPRRNGYHGGLTPKELLVPLVVLSTDDLPEDSG